MVIYNAVIYTMESEKPIENGCPLEHRSLSELRILLFLERCKRMRDFLYGMAKLVTIQQVLYIRTQRH